MTTQKGGRRTKLTAEVQTKICESIIAGNYACVACRTAGVSESTYYAWLERGRHARSGRYLEFLESVTRAETVAEINALANWQAQMPTNWRACQSFLERRFPDRWRLPRDGEAGTGGGAVYVIREEQLDEIQWDAMVDEIQAGKV
jgi:hypothetical protein